MFESYFRVSASVHPYLSVSLFRLVFVNVHCLLACVCMNISMWGCVSTASSFSYDLGASPCFDAFSMFLFRYSCGGDTVDVCRQAN